MVNMSRIELRLVIVSLETAIHMGQVYTFIISAVLDSLTEANRNKLLLQVDITFHIHIHS